MREVSGSYRTGAEKKIRDVGVKILTNDDEAKTIPSDRILSISIQRSVSGGSFSIGNAPSDRLNVVIVGTEKLPKKTRITVYVNFDGSDWERLGRFYVDSCTRNGQRITVTAYDALSLAEKPVKFGGKIGLKALAFPCLMQEMLDYIVALRGMTCNFECQPFTVYVKPMKSETEYYTARELFGFIAACHGCNAKMDYDGKLVFQEFRSVKSELTAGNVIDQTIDDGEPYTVRGVLLNRNDLVSFYVDDVPGSSYDEDADGIVICNNPLSTVEIAEYIWHKIGKLSYYGGSVKIRGAGILECGDVVSIGNLKYMTDSASYPFCITDISYSISREDGFIETLSSEVTRRSSTSGSGFSASPLTAGIGIEIQSKAIDLKPAKIGSYYDSEWKKALGGIYIDALLWGSRQGLYIDYHGALKLLPADYGVPVSGRIEGATGYGGVSIGKGIATTVKGHISVHLGDGMRFNQPPKGEPQYESNWTISPKTGDGIMINSGEGEDGAVRLNLGKGLEFGARKYEKKKNDEGNDTEEDDLTRYTSEVQLKLGKGMKFGENGELIATAEGGKEYKAGENILISEDGTISADVKEYTAGENITISADGKISATGGADLSSGGGITIETDKETGKQTISAAVGEGAEIRDGKICTVPNIQNAVLITEADAKYLLHDFTQIEYNRGSQIGYAGPGNQIVVQGYLAYTTDYLNQGANYIGSYVQYPENWTTNVSRYIEFVGNFYLNSNNRYKKLYLALESSTASGAIYGAFLEKEDGTTSRIYFGSASSIANQGYWSGIGIALEWTTIFPPGYVNAGITFENGCAQGRFHCFWKSNANINSDFIYDRRWINTLYYFPFASLAEYNAAVGLTYEPVTLTEVTDSPTIISGKDIGKE